MRHLRPSAAARLEPGISGGLGAAVLEVAGLEVERARRGAYLVNKPECTLEVLGEVGSCRTDHGVRAGIGRRVPSEAHPWLRRRLRGVEGCFPVLGSAEGF